MDEIKFIKSIPNPTIVTRKNNDLDAKEKEKAYENPNQRRKKNQSHGLSDGTEDTNNKNLKNGNEKNSHVDVFI